MAAGVHTKRRMSVLATKPAPLALGSRDVPGGANRVELLPRKNPLVAQLLEDFVASGKLPQPARPAAKAAPEAAAAPRNAPAVAPNEVAQLRARVEHLETRLRVLEAKERSNGREEAMQLNERVVAVLEQLIAELRER